LDLVDSSHFLDHKGGRYSVNQTFLEVFSGGIIGYLFLSIYSLLVIFWCPFSLSPSLSLPPSLSYLTLFFGRMLLYRMAHYQSNMIIRTMKRVRKKERPSEGREMKEDRRGNEM
jgi:hypothetical protein